MFGTVGIESAGIESAGIESAAGVGDPVWQAGLQAHLGVDVAGLSDAELLGWCADTVIALRRLTAGLVAALGSPRIRDAAAAETGYTPRSWLLADLRCGRGETGRWLGLSRRLGELPLLAAAFADGDLSIECVQALVHTLLAVEAGAERDGLEKALVDIAILAPVRELAAAIAAARAALHLDDPADEAYVRRLADRSVTFAPGFDGWLTGSFHLPPDVGAALQKAINALAAPIDDADERSLPQRRADALAEIADHHLGCADLPDNGGERPRVSIVIDWELLAGGAGVPATLDDGTPVSPAAARRLACDAEILPAILGSAGEVLDIGRTSRVWTIGQRRAVKLRDGNRCAFGSCDHPPVHLHHWQHWADGGPTSIDNAVLLCTYHHWLVHDGGWQLHRDPDGTFVFTGPTGRHRRFHPHRHPGAHHPPCERCRPPQPASS